MNPSDFQPLDFLLYRPHGLFGQLIKFHTGYNISHVEVYLGEKRVTASRDHQGAGFYPVREDDRLAYVMRPKLRGNLAMAEMMARRWDGTPYGWLDLADFFGYNFNARGIVCSPYATVVGRAAGIPLFNGVQARKVAPYMFRTSELLEVAWTDGKDVAFDAEAA